MNNAFLVMLSVTALNGCSVGAESAGFTDTESKDSGSHSDDVSDAGTTVYKGHIGSACKTDSDCLPFLPPDGGYLAYGSIPVCLTSLGNQKQGIGLDAGTCTMTCPIQNAVVQEYDASWLPRDAGTIAWSDSTYPGCPEPFYCKVVDYHNSGGVIGIMTDPVTDQGLFAGPGTAAYDANFANGLGTNGVGTSLCVPAVNDN